MKAVDFDNLLAISSTDNYLSSVFYDHLIYKGITEHSAMTLCGEVTLLLQRAALQSPDDAPFLTVD